MARFDFEIPKELTDKLSKNLSQIDKIAPQMLEEAAPILVETLKKKAKVKTGKMMKGIKAKKAIKSKNDGWILPVVFSGYEKRKRNDGEETSVPNAVKAAVAEYGSSNQAATPFIRPTVEEKRTEVIEKMREVFNREVEKP